eukprot:TRINITY_DN17675_c0_g3_i3.p1 TRINITY_DN17675_c0_g3~~TRINITY_DN17675_c0_g3_i3.p1  ORF type:complete len:149 (+),score=25.69 TRINITY_DN17675_c0_g3_i3:225-671(+)
MPPSGSAPRRRRPNFRCQGLSRSKFGSVNLPVSADTPNEFPSEAVDAELQVRSSGSLPDALHPRIRARQRQRFFGPALAWSDQQRRNLCRTVDFSQIQWQAFDEDEDTDNNSDSDASSCGSELDLDNDPDAMHMRSFLESKFSERVHE